MTRGYKNTGEKLIPPNRKGKKLSPIILENGEKPCTQCKAVKNVDDFINDTRKRDGLKSYCKECASKYSTPEYHREWRKRTPNYNESSRNYQRRVRILALEAYSDGKPRCNCCDESHLEFLAIDHINGGGNQHRKDRGISSIFGWLKKNNYPDGFQILCHNCNMAKGFYGKCPHDEE